MEEEEERQKEMDDKFLLNRFGKRETKEDVDKFAILQIFNKIIGLLGDAVDILIGRKVAKVKDKKKEENEE